MLVAVVIVMVVVVVVVVVVVWVEVGGRVAKCSIIRAPAPPSQRPYQIPYTSTIYTSSAPSSSTLLCQGLWEHGVKKSGSEMNRIIEGLKKLYKGAH
jgi:hypothetical protein